MQTTSQSDNYPAPLCPKMSSARAKKLDLGCFINIKIIRDHTKRKVYEQYETERYDIHPEKRPDQRPVRRLGKIWEQAEAVIGSKRDGVEETLLERG